MRRKCKYDNKVYSFTNQVTLNLIALNEYSKWKLEVHDVINCITYKKHGNFSSIRQEYGIKRV